MDSWPVTPARLRARVLEALHSVHQGVAGVKARACLSIFWPDLDKSLWNYLDTRYYCHIHAPSLPVAVDYFDHGGKSCLVYVDRHSSNLHMFNYPPGRSDAHYLISSCRPIFLYYGALRQLASDGGPTLVT